MLGWDSRRRSLLARLVAIRDLDSVLWVLVGDMVGGAGQTNERTGFGGDEGWGLFEGGGEVDLGWFF